MPNKYKSPNSAAFTLIELLVVISIVGILIGLSIFGLQGARESSRDAKRKSDLELIRSGLETYRADCLTYPLSLSTALMGDDSTTSCSGDNVYIPKVPTDPQTPARSYVYSSDGATYEICSALEDEATPISCGSQTNCGGQPCNYKATNP